MDVIRIHALELDCIVGLRPAERVCAQRLRVDLALGLDTREAGRTGRIAATLDYDRIAEDVIALLQFRRYRLIEVAAEELSSMLLSSYPTTAFVELRLEKPGALAGRARAASIEVRRTQEDLLAAAANETRDADLCVLSLSSSDALPPKAEGARVIDRLLSGQLYSDRSGIWAAGLPCPNPEDKGWRAETNARVFRCTVRAVRSP